MHRRIGPIEIIDVDASPVISVVSKPSPEPAKRRGQGTHATQIPRMPEFKLGYAEKERQIVDQRVVDRKQKTGYNHPPTTVHFAVSVAHFNWDDFEDGEGDWRVAANQWTVDEGNRAISSQGLRDSILSHVRQQTTRQNMKKCPGCLWQLESRAH